MNSYGEKKQENKNQSVADGVSQQQQNKVSMFSPPVMQGNMQEAINNSSRVQQLKSYQEMANNSLRVKQTAQLQKMANEHISQLKRAEFVNPIQLMSDGSQFNRKLLGAKAEEKTALKQWKVGEFYAWDRTNERKDHHHAHVWTAQGDLNAALVEGHVVTAKGEGPESSKRNLTKLKVVGAKGKNNSWSVKSEKTEERLELAKGSKEVPKDKHEEEELLIRSNLENAVYYLLNTPDHELGATDAASNKIEAKLAKRLRLKNAKKAREAADNQVSDDEPMGNLFD